MPIKSFVKYPRKLRVCFRARTTFFPSRNSPGASGITSCPAVVLITKFFARAFNKRSAVIHVRVNKAPGVLIRGRSDISISIRRGDRPHGRLSSFLAGKTRSCARWKSARERGDRAQRYYCIFSHAFPRHNWKLPDFSPVAPLRGAQWASSAS